MPPDVKRDSWSPCLRRTCSWVKMLVLVVLIATLLSGCQFGSQAGTGQAATLPTAPATPEANPYPPYTGSLAWDDPLKDNRQGNWQEAAYLSGYACQFSGEAYQVVGPPDSGGLNCYEGEDAPAGHFSNFTVQVTMTFVQPACPGDQGGIIFRAGPGDTEYYILFLSDDGHYALELMCTQYSNNCLRMLFQGICQVCHKGLSQPNTLAIVANRDNFTFYANGQRQASGTDGTLGTGNLGFFAGEYGLSPSKLLIVIAYQDLKVWLL